MIGAGGAIGDYFVHHRVPRVISFTGSTAVGRRIMELAANSPILKKVALELGGNSPIVILDDADPDLSVDAAIFGKFLHQGQICMSVNRIVVNAKVHDDFVERFVARVRHLKVGNPDDDDTVIGPVINQDQLKKLREHIEKGRAEGARPLLGGEPVGLVLPPHVFADVTNDMAIARDELFGPVASIIKVRDEEQALEVANATPYGLSSAVITRDVERGAPVRDAVPRGYEPRQRLAGQRHPDQPVRGREEQRPGPLQRPVGDRRVHDPAPDHRAARGGFLSVRRRPAAHRGRARPDRSRLPRAGPARASCPCSERAGALANPGSAGGPRTS